MNINGCQDRGKYASLLYHLNKWTQQSIAHVWGIQEHNLNPADHKIHMRLAKDKEFKLVIAYAKQNNGGGHTGGTLFLISMRHATLIQSKEHDPGALEIQVDFGGAQHYLFNSYTPVSTIPRIDYLNKIKTKLHEKMIGMGDWNCVPNVTLDVQSANPLKYPNGEQNYWNTAWRQ